MVKDNRPMPYSFYVPQDDRQCMRFIESQANLSLSVRLLIKAFMANNENVPQDVASMDLDRLLASMDLNKNDRRRERYGMPPFRRV